jgi:hypothetical protein
MRIFIICSKHFYSTIPPIRAELERAGHTITLPNCFDDPGTEARMHAAGSSEHAQWKAKMIRRSEKTIATHDAVLVLNFEKHGQRNYIGGATFLEIYDAFRLGKPIYLYNPIPEGMLHDELCGFQPIILNGDLKKLV